jgi:glycosyltransferase involved in cell wall biosynthesis
MDGFHLKPRRYLLYVSRLEPENNPDTVIRAFGKVETDWRLVIVGGNPYDGRYLRHLRSIADHRVVFTGPVYGQRYWQLLKNAGMYVSGSEVGGTHPGLIEAMVTENLVLYRNTPENCEAVADCGIPFDPGVEDLAVKMRSALQHPNWRAEMGARSRARVESIYSWDCIAERYEGLLQGRVLSQAVPATPQRATRSAWQPVGSGPAHAPHTPTPAIPSPHVSEDGA